MKMIEIVGTVVLAFIGGIAGMILALGIRLILLASSARSEPSTEHGMNYIALGLIIFGLMFGLLVAFKAIQFRTTKNDNKG